MSVHRYHVTKLVRGYMPAIDRVPVLVRMHNSTGEVRFSRCTLQDAIGVAQRHLAKYTRCNEVTIVRGNQVLSVVTREQAFTGHPSPKGV